MTPEHRNLYSLFLPHDFEAMRRLEADGGAPELRLVHYTTTEAAVSILKSEKVWMRNAALMNDFREIQHGIECFEAACNAGAGSRLGDLLNEVHEGIAAEINHALRNWADQIRKETYLISLSEHEPAEDNTGKLSMWRAYGSGRGVALVLNTTAFRSESEALGAYTSKVFYADAEIFTAYFDALVTQLEANVAALRALSRQGVLDWMYVFYRATLLSTKHPGFAEEKEWRVLFSPIEPSRGRIVKSSEIIGGIFQKIYVLPLIDFPEENHIGAALPGLLNRLIIGPTSYPFSIYQAFVDLLQEKGIDGAEGKVYASNIPLRS